MKKMIAVFCANDPKMVEYVYTAEQQVKLAQIVDLKPLMLNEKNIAQEDFSDVELIFTTWSMGVFSEEQIAKRLPNLTVVFYAAGATDYFVRPFFARKVTVLSAWLANAIPVAEFVVGQILLAMKGFFRNRLAFVAGADYNSVRTKEVGPGVYGAEVVLIGAGAISSYVQKLLENFNVKVTVVPSRKERRTVSLEEVFARAQVISNHLPNREDNQGVLDGKLFASMIQGATFINTGRGAQVNESDLIDVLKARPDLTALLDVTDPEPPAANSELYKMPNIHLSTHIAGSMNDEVHRMADYMIEELESYLAGRQLRYEVREDMLITSKAK